MIELCYEYYLYGASACVILSHHIRVLTESAICNYLNVKELLH